MRWEEARNAIGKDRTKGARVQGHWEDDYFCVSSDGELLYYHKSLNSLGPLSRPAAMWLDHVYEWELIERIDAQKPSPRPKTRAVRHARQLMVAGSPMKPPRKKPRKPKELDEALRALTELAQQEADGHFTIMKFTGNWRVSIGTPQVTYPEGYHWIHCMAEGDSLIEAINKAVRSGRRF